MSNQQNDAKRAAARRVIQDFVFDGMTLGAGFRDHLAFLCARTGPACCQGLAVNLHHNFSCDERGGA
ncbi:ribose 5-phosphate isomerase [Yersinia pseudotuberculosis]|nr:ribose 5-phosphate isomerase [Yersinia pseudotuberculosis]CQD51230.1 ribose 5-phosphate isomerase [Yersinia intermedia]VEA91778.1 ribose 5-phosphate isomerase [Yersinia pseudotuberculosis]VEB13120.1 ribose 5-phosphate isomerase [Yersinia pseudotuberculosis]